MRTTISIPDSTFEAAAQVARQLGITRSELFTRAVTAFVQAYADEITAQRNPAYVEPNSVQDEELGAPQIVFARCGFSDSW